MSNLPPGTTHKHIDDLFADRPCDCCGRWPDDCICPPCPVCEAVGNPTCYGDSVAVDGSVHGMKLNTAQLIGATRRRIEHLQEQISDEETYINYLEDQELAKTFTKE
jgi:hypothetical protein